MVLRNTGLRINELLALEVRHFNLAGPDFFLYTRRSKKRGLGIKTSELPRAATIGYRPTGGG
jgi:integrase